MFSIFSNVMSRNTHSEPGLPMVQRQKLLPLYHSVQRKSAYKLLDSGAEKLFFRGEHQLLTFESLGERLPLI